MHETANALANIRGGRMQYAEEKIHNLNPRYLWSAFMLHMISKQPHIF